MAEKTSVWKGVRRQGRENTFLEFDYLAVLDNIDIDGRDMEEQTRTVRGSDYSPAIELSEQKDKLVTATGDTEKYSEKQANKVWLNSVYWFSRY